MKASTLQSYNDVLRNYVLPEIGRIPLAKLAPTHVQAMMRELEARGLSPRTQIYARAVLRKALNQAARWGDVSRNVAALVDPPAKARKERPVLNRTQALALLAATAGDPLEALFRVAVAMGLRQGEILALRWEDVDLEKHQLTVSGTLTRLTGQGLVRTSTKTNTVRIVPLPDNCAEALRAHRKRQREEPVAAGPAWSDLGFVFTTQAGTPLDARSLGRRWHAIRDAAGLPGTLHFHDLRHSAATLLLAQGVPITTVSRLLGHASIRITADVYGHVGLDLLRDAADAMDQILG